MPVQAYQKIFNLPRVNPGQSRALYTKRTAFVFIKEFLCFVGLPTNAIASADHPSCETPREGRFLWFMVLDWTFAERIPQNPDRSRHWAAGHPSAPADRVPPNPARKHLF